MAPGELAAGPTAGGAAPAQQAASGTRSHLCSPGGCPVQLETTERLDDVFLSSH